VSRVEGGSHPLPRRGGDHGYLWANHQSGEGRRLQLLEGLADARSFRLLAEAGVTVAWNCAEMGAGGGSVVGWLSDRVGPTGRVMAVALDARFLGPLSKRPNVEIVEADLATMELVPGSFDLVHTRNVLVHLREPDSIVTKLVDAVRTGRVLLLEEPDYYPLAGTSSPLFARVMAPLAKRLLWARRLPALLFGLPTISDISVFVETDMLQGGTPLAAFWAATIDAAAKTIIEASVTTRELTPVSNTDITDVLELLDDPSFWTPLVAVICVTARKG
jgi:SAM-dependent methyltransferase